MSGWLEGLGFKLGRGLRRVLRRSLLLLGVSAAIPVPAIAADWNVSTASSNFGIFALSNTQLAERKITVTPIGELELPTGEIKVRPMMYLALSYDHRVIDGREAVTFLVRVKEAIEDPTRLLIDL